MDIRLDKKTKRVLKKHFLYCLRYRNFRTKIYIKGEGKIDKVIECLETIRPWYDGNILMTKSDIRHKYIIDFRNGSRLIVTEPTEVWERGARCYSVVIDEKIPELYRNNVIYPGLHRRLVYVPYWFERIAKTIDKTKSYPHPQKSGSLKKYVDIISI